ncbi:MAG TPA: hypothetical protein VFZ58_05375 [Candidatus Saccharimonadales bacterium]
MNFGQPDVHLVGMAAVYQLGVALRQLRQKLQELERQYPELQEELEHYETRWRQLQESNFDSIGYDDGGGVQADIDRLAQQAKQLRRGLLDLIKQADPNYPDEEEYAAYCAAVDAQSAALLKMSQ